MTSNFPVSITRAVKWGEMDAFNHVNNTVYFRWFEESRIEYFIQCELYDYMEKNGIGPILASTNCKFKRAVAFPDNVTISTGVSDISEDRFTMVYKVVSEKDSVTVAEGSAVCVVFDYKKNEKALLPTEVEDAIKEIENIE